MPGHPAEADAILRHVVPGDGSHDVRLSDAANTDPRAVDGVEVLQRGRRGVVLAAGPALDATLAATAGRDATVACTATPRPFDAPGLREAVGDGPADVVVVEPYLAGASARVVADALSDRLRRQLGLGVRSEELRRYGSRLFRGFAACARSRGL